MNAYGEDRVREQPRTGVRGERPVEDPEGPEGPHAPETPQAPDPPDVPESPELPPHRAPASPDLPDLPGVPDVPDVHGPGEMPAVPDAPDILEPEIPPAPDVPPAPELPEMPEIPDAPEMPETPGIYDVPEIPDPPEIDDAPDLPGVTEPTEVPGTPEGPLSPDKPDLPRAPDFPDAPPPHPEGRTAGRDAGTTAMHSNHTDQPERPGRPGGYDHITGSFEQDAGAEEQREETLAHGSGAGSGRAGGPGGFIGTGGGGSGADVPDGRPAGDGASDGEGDSDAEAALRRMLHESVRDIQPAPQSLTYLRHAIPARRAHRRRAIVGAAAAVVLAGVGVPSLVGTGLMPGASGDRSVNAGDSHGRAQSVGGSENGGHTQGPEGVSGGSGRSAGKDGASGGSASPSPSAGKTTGGADPNDTLATSAPSCGRQQLGRGTATSETPESDGKVYGSFRVVNTSSETCTVEGEGVVGASARGRADVDRINVLDHTPGDAAVRLPDPDESPGEVVLRPGDAYVVRFAWIPDECPVQGSPVPKSATGNGPEGGQGGNNGSGGEDGGGDGDAGGGTGTPSTGGGDGGVGGGDDGGSGEDDKPSVVLTHTPDVGDPAVADTELDGACAGTLYRTGVLASR